MGGYRGQWQTQPKRAGARCWTGSFVLADFPRGGCKPWGAGGVPLRMRSVMFHVEHSLRGSAFASELVLTHRAAPVRNRQCSTWNMERTPRAQSRPSSSSSHLAGALNAPGCLFHPADVPRGTSRAAVSKSCSRPPKRAPVRSSCMPLAGPSCKKFFAQPVDNYLGCLIPKIFHKSRPISSLDPDWRTPSKRFPQEPLLLHSPPAVPLQRLAF